MKYGRHAVAAILAYVALDLCVASMPGAFVFDAGASVETAMMSRVRHAAIPAAPVAPADARWDHVVIPREVRRDVVKAPRRVRPVIPARDAGASAGQRPAPPADDPH